ncbi:Rv3654c family TadE-like protein [Streptomyces sp. NPDC004980]
MAGQGRVTDAWSGPACSDAQRGGGRIGRGHGGSGAVRAVRGRSPAGDSGLATVWVAVTTLTLCAVFATVLALGQAVAARHEAGGAADLAALAAADRALRGEVAACGAAKEVARAQEAEVVRCVVQGEIADVTVRVRFGPYRPEVRSRAGPPTAGVSGTATASPPGRRPATAPTGKRAPTAPAAATSPPSAVTPTVREALAEPPRAEAPRHTHTHRVGSRKDRAALLGEAVRP